MNPNVSEFAWRTGRAPRPYMRDARRILSKHRAEIPHAKVDFLHLPIVDGLVTADALVDSFCDDLIARVHAGQRMYIHCWGGHGRTGTVVAIMLGRMFNMTISEALSRTQRLHDSREIPQDCRSPSTPCQRAQVKRLLGGSKKVPPPGNPAPGMARGGSRGMGMVGRGATAGRASAALAGGGGGGNLFGKQPLRGGVTGSRDGNVPLPPVGRTGGVGGVGRPLRRRALGEGVGGGWHGHSVREGGVNSAAAGPRGVTSRKQPPSGLLQPPPPPVDVAGLPRRRPLRR